MGAEAKLAALAAKVADHDDVPWDLEITAESDDPRIVRLRRIAELCHAVREGESASDAADEPASWGGLEIRELLGAGAFGRVYRAFDPALRRDVALKLGRLSAASLEEARRIARVRHGNVLQVHGVAEHEGQTGIWTELVDGASLEERLAEDGTMGAEEAAQVGRTLCAALAAVHGAGLVHRDVKTANVVRERGGRLVLLDFSSAAPAGSDMGVSGTPLFMAPEVLAGAEASRASDIYALGVVLYRLVTGAYPVEADSLEALKKAPRVPLRDRRPDLPDWFTGVVERALDPSPAGRFASAGAMDAALRRGSEGSGTWLVRAGVVLLSLAVAAAVVVGILRERPIATSPSILRVQGTETLPLAKDAVLRPGDRLALELTLRRKAHVYVLDRDAGGHEFALFPLSGLDLQNPLPERSGFHLPGTIGGEPFSWQVTSEGGTETLMVVVSREAIPELEAALAHASSAVAGEPYRGVGGLVPGAPGPSAGRSPAEVFKDLRKRVNRDLWAWETTFACAP